MGKGIPFQHQACWRERRRLVSEPKILRFEDTRRLPWDYANAKRTSSMTLVASVLSALSENPFRKRDTCVSSVHFVCEEEYASASQEARMD